MTHAIFKALLFLASGSVIHGVDTQNMHEMGGLRKKMPITFWTWAIGSAALAGIYPLAGFWSKDEILLAAYEGHFTALFWILVVAATFTAFYITRATILTFFGKPRDKRRYDHAHESPLSMTVPLVILAVLAVVLGFANSPHTDWWFSHFVYYGHPHEAAASGLRALLGDCQLDHRRRRGHPHLRHGSDLPAGDHRKPPARLDVTQEQVLLRRVVLSRLRARHGRCSLVSSAGLTGSSSTASSTSWDTAQPR